MQNNIVEQWSMESAISDAKTPEDIQAAITRASKELSEIGPTKRFLNDLVSCTPLKLKNGMNVAFYVNSMMNFYAFFCYKAPHLLVGEKEVPRRLWMYIDKSRDPHVRLFALDELNSYYSRLYHSAEGADYSAEGFTKIMTDPNEPRDMQGYALLGLAAIADNYRQHIPQKTPDGMPLTEALELISNGIHPWRNDTITTPVRRPVPDMESDARRFYMTLTNRVIPVRTSLTRTCAL